MRLRSMLGISLLSCSAAIASQASGQTLPAPENAGFEHVIVVMMENRSFDHFLGWLPAANGKQAGLTYLDSKGVPHPTHSLAPDYQGCAFLDPGHSYGDGRVQYNNGGADGWLLDGSDEQTCGATDPPTCTPNPKQANDVFSIGYYVQQDLAFLGAAAPAFTVCDNYFAGILGPTYPNRFYMHAAQTDRLENSSTTSTLPTIYDRLIEKGVSTRYYFSDLPFLALWGTKYANISKPFSQFLADAKAGTLPNYAFIDPRFEDEGSGTSGDDHPHADIRTGEAFLNQIYDALRTSPNWSKTVFVITYDEWGGFYDHVPPPLAPIPAASAQAGDKDGRLGFRVPCIVISPLAKRNFIAHEQFDHTSILKMVEWRFGLPALTNRDSSANNLADVLNLGSPNSSAPAFIVPTGPFNGACPPSSAPANDPEATEWSTDLKELRDLATTNGFKGVK